MNVYAGQTRSSERRPPCTIPASPRFASRYRKPDLDDLADRLARTRWADELPEKEVVAGGSGAPAPAGWEYGVPVSYVRDLVERWRTSFDWRAREAELNEYPQFTTEIDGQRIHFVHVRSAQPDAVPLVLTHGWPNSFVEYLGLVGPLTDPAAHGRPGAPAFHVVIPSLPGFTFSGPTREHGWSAWRTAAAWAELMRRLGYDRYGAHGNDAGAIVSPLLGELDREHVIGVHVTQIFSFPRGDAGEFDGLTGEEFGALAVRSGVRPSTPSTTGPSRPSRRPWRTPWPTRRPGSWPGAGSSSAPRSAPRTS